MCGRFTQRYTWGEVHAFLDVFGTPKNLQPRYNIAPLIVHHERGEVVLAFPVDPRSRPVSVSSCRGNDQCAESYLVAL